MMWPKVKKNLNVHFRLWRRRLQNERGATMLEWVLLLVVIALPTAALVTLGLKVLAGHYQLLTALNAMPFP